MKHLLISGGTRGIGAATVKRFIEENFYCGYPIIIDRLLDLDNLTL